MNLTMSQDMMLQQEKLASNGHLAAGLAHEINNPLGFLKSNQTMLMSYFKTFRDLYEKAKAIGNTEFEALARESDVEYAFEEADHIFLENEDGFSRIKRIISNLMSFSRMENAESFEDYDVNAGIESTLVVAWNEIKYVADVTKDQPGDSQYSRKRRAGDCGPKTAGKGADSHQHKKRGCVRRYYDSRQRAGNTEERAHANF